MEEDFKHMVRIARKDVDGNKPVAHAIADIKAWESRYPEP